MNRSPSPAAEPMALAAEPFRLTLYVNGASDLSRHAIAEAKSFCDRLPGGYELLVLDLETHVSEAHADGVRATPTLIVFEPEGARRYIGDLSATDRVAAALGLALTALSQPSGSGEPPP
jgi:hypothetical protein